MERISPVRTSAINDKFFPYDRLHEGNGMPMGQPGKNTA